MDNEIGEIDCINFGIYSTQEIISMSTCKIDNTKKSGHNSVYDLRMGTIENHQECETCNQNSEICPGHFGYIELNEPIIHPLFYRRVESYLRCFCIKCYRLILQPDQFYLSELNKFKGEARFTKILDKIKKTDICCHEDCQNEQPEFKYSPTENIISMIYQVKAKGKVNIVMTVDEIKKIFDNISDEDVDLLGFDPKYTHPKNLIMCVMPVIPPCDRPYVKVDGHICDDDLTIQYIDIIKLNNSLLEEDLSEAKKQKIMAGLRFRILTTFNNSQGRAKQTTNARPIKGIKERLTGKDGQLRNNMMGKRCEQTARTVIGPEPTLKLNQVAIPREVAQTLTIPVKVANFNIKQLTEIVNSGKANYVLKNGGKTRINLEKALFKTGTRLMGGDIIIRNDKEMPIKTGREILQKGDLLKRDGKIFDKIEYPSQREYKLEIGDIVERHLQDYDWVLLNRQPTLHSGSMQAMQVIIKPHKTFRFNLAICKQFNSDFDGKISYCRQ